MTDDSSASNRDLINRIARGGHPRMTSRRSTHLVYTVLMRVCWEDRKCAVSALADRIATIPGVARATPWLSREGDRLRIYLSFGTPNPSSGWHDTPYYLDVKYGDPVRFGDRPMPDGHRDRIGSQVLDAVAAAWLAWARDTISKHR